LYPSLISKLFPPTRVNRQGLAKCVCVCVCLVSWEDWG